jgi:O-methyltransferase
LESPAALYLELMKKSLTNTIYDEPDLVPVTPRGFLKRQVVKAFAGRGITLASAQPASATRARGLYNNPRAHTMIGLERLTNIQRCVEQALADRVPGDLIETGVWRGGATAFMRAILKAHGVKDRVVWVADSFEGLPPPDAEVHPEDAGDKHHTLSWLAVSEDDVKETFRRYDLLDGQVRFLKGWFKDTLPGAPIERLAVMRLDGDMYGSTMDALTSLYPKLSVGGYVILDDWEVIPTCRKAIDDFRAANGITEPVMPVDGNAGYWRRER